MKSELLTFCSDVWTVYSALGPVNKVIMGLVVGYAALRVTADISKFMLIKALQSRRPQNNPKDPKYNPEKVYLHMFFRRITKQVPNLSPYAIKVETWLRMTGIQYEVVETRAFSKATKQVPYINHRGVEFLYSYTLRGLGRKKPADVYHIGEADIRAISLYLGNKLFIMGDKIKKVDCAVFGHLCQIVYVDFHYPHTDVIRDHCPNIRPYMDRIKDKCWPDWDEVVHKGHFF